MSGSERYSWIKHFDFIVIDLLALLLAFLASYWIKFQTFSAFVVNNWPVYVLLMVVTEVFLTLLLNPYSGMFRRRYYEDLISQISFVLYQMLIVAILMYVFKLGSKYSRNVMLITYTGYYVLTSVLKYCWKKILLRRFKRMSISEKKKMFLVVNAEDYSRCIEELYASDFIEYVVDGVCLLGDAQQEVVSDKTAPAFVVENDINDYISKNQIKNVFVAVDPWKIEKKNYQQWVNSGINIHISIMSLTGVEATEQMIGKIGIHETVRLGDFSFSPSQIIYMGLKRILDILCGIIGCIVLLPLILAVKLANLLCGDLDSIFYTQERIGKKGRIIRIYKFRSMVKNADEVLVKLLKDEKNRAEWDRNQKLDNDPRITRVGAFLRKTSLDEAPQILNVLKGEMSLIGPRPLVPGELEAHNGLKLYNVVKPGITGWWACNGRSNIEYNERLELEYYYIKHLSFSLDVVCMIRTVGAVISKKGAK